MSARSVVVDRRGGPCAPRASRRASLPGSVAAALIAATPAGCSAPEAQPAPRCEGVASTAQLASAEGRAVLGLAARYPADATLAAREGELRRSQRARRAAAWRAVARALAPVPLARAVGVRDATVPRFRTWYDREDVIRTFQRLYGALTPEARAAGSRFSESGMDEAFGWNVHFVTTLPEWGEERVQRFAASLDTPAALNNVQGVSRVAVSPDLARHLMQSYPEVVRCMNGEGVPVFVDGPPSSQRVARESVSLGPCGARAFGPFHVATGGALTARLEGAGGAVSLRVSDASNAEGAVRCAASAAAGCTVAGPGTYRVHIEALETGARGMLEVRHQPPDAPRTPCLDGVFPLSAASVSMEWRRAFVFGPLPTYDTSAAGVARRLGPDGSATWGDGDGTAEPSEAEIYTQRTSTGNTYRLAAMHLRVREVENWLNVTIWWSPNPADDFGADRPAEILALGGPWSHYKMCVTSDYTEEDPDPTGGFSRDAPSLAAALRAAYERQGGPSWCSNPYLSSGPQQARTNCVGCHQHALSGLFPAEVQLNPDRFPARGRARLRNNLPADGFWGIDAGDRLGAVLVETVDYHRATR